MESRSTIRAATLTKSTAHKPRSRMWLAPIETWREAHVFEDVMQLVDLIREDIPTTSTAEHARHVIEIFDAAYRSAQSGNRPGTADDFLDDLRQRILRVSTEQRESATVQSWSSTVVLVVSCKSLDIR